MSNIEKYKKSVFEKIKKNNEYGAEFWLARELAEILEYKRWDKFLNVIEKAKAACINSMIEVENHFSHLGKMVRIGSGAERRIDDIMLSRYACYLIVQNADSRKEIVSLGQTYFAFQTRRQELQEEYAQLTEEKKRLAIRNELKKHIRRITRLEQK